MAWRVPFGRVESLEKIGVMNTGSYNIGGSVATASGLLFIGASDDQRFHAYESKTGKLLWETKLPANGFANPITYLGQGRKAVCSDHGGGDDRSHSVFRNVCRRAPRRNAAAAKIGRPTT